MPSALLKLSNKGIKTHIVTIIHNKKNNIKDRKKVRNMQGNKKALIYTRFEIWTNPTN